MKVCDKQKEIFNFELLRGARVPMTVADASATSTISLSSAKEDWLIDFLNMVMRYWRMLFVKDFVHTGHGKKDLKCSIVAPFHKRCSRSACPMPGKCKRFWQKLTALQM